MELPVIFKIIGHKACSCVRNSGRNLVGNLPQPSTLEEAARCKDRAHESGHGLGLLARPSEPPGLYEHANGANGAADDSSHQAAHRGPSTLLEQDRSQRQAGPARHGRGTGRDEARRRASAARLLAEGREPLRHLLVMVRSTLLPLLAARGPASGATGRVCAHLRSKAGGRSHWRQLDELRVGGEVLLEQPPHISMPACSGIAQRGASPAVPDTRIRAGHEELLCDGISTTAGSQVKGCHANSAPCIWISLTV